MPRVALTVQEIGRTGHQPTFGAAETDGNSWNNTGHEFIHVKNGATNVDVTIQTARTVDGQAVTNRTVTVPATEERLLGPFPPALFNQGGSIGDVVHVNYDDVTNVTVGVFRL